MRFINSAHKRIRFNVVRFAITGRNSTPGIFIYRDKNFFPVWIKDNDTTDVSLKGDFFIPRDFTPSHITGISFSPPITVDDEEYFLAEIDDSGFATIVDIMNVKKLYGNILCNYDFGSNSLSVNVLEKPDKTLCRIVIGKGRPLYASNVYFLEDVLEKVVDQDVHSKGIYVFDIPPINGGYTLYFMVYDNLSDNYFITNTYTFGLLGEKPAPSILNIFQLNNGIVINFSTPVFPLYIYRRDAGSSSYKTIGVASDTHVFIDNSPFSEGHFVYKVGYSLKGKMVYSNEKGVDFYYCKPPDKLNVHFITLDEEDFYMDILRIIQPVIMRYGVSQTMTHVYTDNDEHEIKADEAGSMLNNRVGAYVINRTDGDVYVYPEGCRDNPEAYGMILEAGKHMFLQIESSRWYFKAPSTGNVVIVEVA